MPTPSEDLQKSPRACMLIVEGDRLLRHLLGLEAREVGCEADGVATGADAIRALEAVAYDIALVDARVREPDLRGLVAVARALRPGLRLITLVPFHDGRMLVDAMALTPFACLRLPCSTETLRSVIELAQRARPADEAFPPGSFSSEPSGSDD